MEQQITHMEAALLRMKMHVRELRQLESQYGEWRTSSRNRGDRYGGDAGGDRYGGGDSAAQQVRRFPKRLTT